MSSVNKAIESSKQWDLDHRVLLHATLHQYALMVEQVEPDEPIIKEYKEFSYDAISSFLGDDSDQECFNKVALADEAYNALYSSLGQTTDKDIRKNPFASETNPSFIARIHLSLAPTFLQEPLETLSEEEIDEYFEDIELDEEGQRCFSDKLLKLAVSVTNYRIERLNSFIDDNPVLSWDEDIISDDNDSDNPDSINEPPTSRYNIINHKLAYENLRRIANGDGLYAQSNKPVLSTFDPKPPVGFETSDPSSFYRNQIRYMFGTIDYNSNGDVGDFAALELCIKTWIKTSINYFYKGDYDTALYIISAVLTEFVKGLQLDIIREELDWNYDFLYNMEEYLDDALFLTIFYMEYVDNEVYGKVAEYLDQLCDTQKEDKENPLSIDFESLKKYLNRRKSML